MSLISPDKDSAIDSETKIAEKKEAFDVMDSKVAGTKGALNVEKLRAVLLEYLVNSACSFRCSPLFKQEQYPTDDELRDMIAGIDTSNSGDVQFDEFLALMDDKNPIALLKDGDFKEDELISLEVCVFGLWLRCLL